MPKIDLTITISVIVALCAIISPIFTTLLNNRYLFKLEESKQKTKELRKHCAPQKGDFRKLHDVRWTMYLLFRS